MIDNPIIFYLASSTIITFSLLALFAKNVIYSLLSAIVVFFAGAILFYVLGSEYNAIIQAAIYGFAVPILIGLSLMFLSKNQKREKHFITPYIAILSACIFVLAFIYVVLISLNIVPDTFYPIESISHNSFDTIRAFAKGLFVNYVWAFELVSILLTIVIAGIGLLQRKRGL